MMIKKHKKICVTLNYIEYFLTLASGVPCCISVSTFASLLIISIGNTTSDIRLKIGSVSAGIKTQKSIINKNKMKHDRQL